MELKFHLTEKSESFNPRTDITILKKLGDRHYVSVSQHIVSDVGSSQASIDYDEFCLLCKKIKYDVDAWKEWQHKCTSTEANAYAAHQSFKLLVDEKLGQNSDILTSKTVSFEVWDDSRSEKNLNRIMDVRRDFCKRQLQKPPHVVPFVPIWNQASPSCITSAIQKVQLNAFSWAICEHDGSLGVLIMPVHSNLTNKKYLSDVAILEKLSKCNFLFDEVFSILFEKKLDKRDQRPLTYTGRLVFPASLGAAAN